MDLTKEEEEEDDIIIEVDEVKLPEVEFGVAKKGFSEAEIDSVTEEIQRLFPDRNLFEIRDCVRNLACGDSPPSTLPLLMDKGMDLLLATMKTPLEEVLEFFPDADPIYVQKLLGELNEATQVIQTMAEKGYNRRPKDSIPPPVVGGGSSSSSVSISEGDFEKMFGSSDSKVSQEYRFRLFTSFHNPCLYFYHFLL